MEKRELPTRHNFLTEAVQNLLVSRSKTSKEPLIDSKTILSISSDAKALVDCKYQAIPKKHSPTPYPNNIKTVVKIIEPVRAIKNGNTENIISDEVYLKRHRRYEMDEKKQKNREKEKLKHGYYQQKQLVERIKTMEKSQLQSIVSSIRHRTHQKEEDDLDEIHDQLLEESIDLLKRYESLGFYSTSENTVLTTVPSPPHSIEKEKKEPEEESDFQKAVKSQLSKKQKTISSFSNYGSPKEMGSIRRSTRHVIAFGQRLPLFETQEFELPSSILDYKKE